LAGAGPLAHNDLSATDIHLPLKNRNKVVALAMSSTLPFEKLSRDDQIKRLYEEGLFVVGIRYYGYKVNLFLLGTEYFEVFINHKKAYIERIDRLDTQHSRMKFYADQVRLPQL